MDKPDSSPKTQPTREEIALRAHGYYEQENFPENRDLDHWFRAERELMEERASNTPPSPWPQESGAGA
jgi:hypothetical protein